jgi:hypothetical protein
MKEKRVNLSIIAMIIKVGMTKVYRDLQEEFDKWPEDEDGTLVTFEQLNMGMVELENFAMKLIENVTGKLPDTDIIIEPDPEEPKLEYETKFHHTNKGALVLCEGQTMDFDSCSVEGIEIPRHNKDSGGDKGRETYMHTTHRPVFGDIVCKKDRKLYRYKSGAGIIYGSCNEPDPESKYYPSKYHHTLVGGSDGGVSFVTCPGQKRDYASVSCEGINMRQHGSSKGTLDRENRQCWWNMREEPKENTDIECITEDGEKHYYRISKSKIVLRGLCG